MVMAGLTAMAMAVGFGPSAQAADGFYEIVNFGSGVYRFINRATGKCMDLKYGRDADGTIIHVRGGSTSAGAQIQSVHCTGFGNAAQVWSFRP
ncbi:RICIN domain-containing protein [Lentzea tibetensis]|uniref:RICIN domain-containing protein n=1 Tax=Lentzea tibetensis TaxID=2591470 RepID=A0A563EJU3_9PSEU|nr:RICIN domain-containing protein [Lentzea tibetensis]TWP46975.1 RICIN domain-containing protein [Lentzea tibetensis]